MTLDDISLQRQQFISDHHRPQFHYLPPQNWMNDPNGTIQWNGRYHLFYQHNPNGAFHGTIHWGHAVSDDLIHWQDLPVAIAPTPNSVDEGGIFSGCIVNDNGVAKMFYTGVTPDYMVQKQCLAIGDDDLITWEKFSSNPVIDSLPAVSHQTVEFRDPFVWKEDDVWYMVLGSCIKGVGGAAFLYRSDDLENWQYLNPLMVGDLARNGVIWECPNFFRLGDKWVLIVSSHIGYTTATVLYFIGEYKNHRFIPEQEGVLDAAYFYAPLTHLDDQGRRIMYAWVREGRSESLQRESGWSGVQIIPRVLSLDEHNRLTMTPTDRLQQLRTNHQQFSGDDLNEGDLFIFGRQMEIHASFEVDTQPDHQVGIDVLVSSDGREFVRITYEGNSHALRVERHYFGENADLETVVHGVTHRLDEGETLDLLILVDGSLIEIIANKRASVTTRFYPHQADSQHLRVIHTDALKQLDIWEMSSIW